MKRVLSAIVVVAGILSAGAAAAQTTVTTMPYHIVSGVQTQGGDVPIPVDVSSDDVLYVTVTIRAYDRKQPATSVRWRAIPSFDGGATWDEQHPATGATFVGDPDDDGVSIIGSGVSAAHYAGCLFRVELDSVTTVQAGAQVGYGPNYPWTEQ